MITKGKVVSLVYTLTNPKGDKLDFAPESDPFVYVQGSGQMLPALENVLEGMKIGESKKVTLAPKDAYGERMEKLKLKLKRSAFPAGTNLSPGAQFQTKNAKGQDTICTVVGTEGDTLIVDTNHPLAGQTLCFELMIKDIKDSP